MTSFLFGVLACPGCSAPNLLEHSFRYPSHAKWGLLIVVGTLAVPVLLYLVGFRLDEKRVVTKKGVAFYTLLLFLGWTVTWMSGPRSPNFGAFLLHWLYLPHLLQFGFLLPIGWPATPAVIIFAGLVVIPAVFCFLQSRWLLAADRRIVWKRTRRSDALPASVPAPGVVTAAADIIPPCAPASPEAPSAAPEPRPVSVLEYRHPSTPRPARPPLSAADMTAALLAADLTAIGCFLLAAALWPDTPMRAGTIPLAALAAGLASMVTLAIRNETQRTAALDAPPPAAPVQAGAVVP